MRTIIAVIALILFVAACSDQGITNPAINDPVEAHSAPFGHDADGLTVMTMNAYYGADFTPLLTAPLDQVPFVTAAAWAQAQQSDIPGRAGRIAAIIARARPDLVGLQEAAIYRLQHPGDAVIGGTIPATDVVYDFAELILDSLAARGLHYTLAAADSTTDVELPAFAGLDAVGNPTFDDVRFTDRDAVLAHVGLGAANPRHAVYQAYIPVSLGGTQTGVHEGWSSVDVPVRGETYRFVSTHLEFQDALPVQLGQVTELLGTLSRESRPTIVVGDFNSDASGLRPDRATPSYGMMLDAGFTDAWLSPWGPRHDAGLTCCEADDLLNASPAFDQRLDFVFTRNVGTTAGDGAGLVVTDRQVIGDEPLFRTAGGRWPSDHAAVVVTLRPRAPRSLAFARDGRRR